MTQTTGNKKIEVMQVDSNKWALKYLHNGKSFITAFYFGSKEQAEKWVGYYERNTAMIPA